MQLQVRGKTDESLDALMNKLAEYQLKHPHAEIEIYRQNSVSIRFRIVDPDFSGISKTERHNLIWKLLDELPDEVQADITTVLLLTPEEKKKSFASIEFDDPIPSRL